MQSFDRAWSDPPGWATLVLLAFLALATAPGSTAAAMPCNGDMEMVVARGQGTAASSVALSPCRRVTASTFAADSVWKSIWKPIERFMGTQSGMIQVACVSMILALVIIWYRRV